MQRALYTFVVRSLLPDTPSVRAELLYLGKGQRATRAILDMDPSEFLDAVVRATGVLRSGRAVPGIDTFQKFKGHALALPAVSEFYPKRKEEALRRALADLAPVWELE